MFSKPDSRNNSDLFHITNASVRLDMVTGFTSQIMDIVSSEFGSNNQLNEFINNHYQSNTLDKLTMGAIKFELHCFIENKLEDFLWVTSLNKGNVKFTHQLSELLQSKYKITNEDLKMLLDQFILDKKFSSSNRIGFK